VIFFVGVAAALLLGLGYVLQQRVAATAPLSEVLHFRLLFDLMHRPLWWAGIGAMVAGQLLSGYALQLATVALVEPLLSTSLLFALLFSSIFSRIRIRLTEIAGALLLSAALGIFIYIGNPHSSQRPRADTVIIVVALLAVLATVALIVGVAKRKPLVAESILLAAGAGILYGLQDASTRGALVTFDHHGLLRMFVSPWVYIVLTAAVLGILLAQSAFKTARLDYSLPPIAAAEPVVGIVLGVTLLGDDISVTPLGLAMESLCLVAMIAGVALIGRSANLAAGGCVPPVVSPAPASRADSP
jgi:drug/metabolite transporter (DMT)-like permease